MKYFVNFKHSKVECSWERETDQEHPDYIKDNIFEVTKEQYDLSRFLTLENDAVVWKQPKYQEYLDRQAEKADRKNEIALLKQADSIIQGWSSLSDIDLPFLKKFFRRILKDMAE